MGKKIFTILCSFFFHLNLCFSIFQSSLKDSRTDALYGHPVPLTAYVLIALYKIETDVSGVSWFSEIPMGQPGSFSILSNIVFFQPFSTQNDQYSIRGL